MRRRNGGRRCHWVTAAVVVLAASIAEADITASGMSDEGSDVRGTIQLERFGQPGGVPLAQPMPVGLGDVLACTTTESLVLERADRQRFIVGPGPFRVMVLSETEAQNLVVNLLEGTALGQGTGPGGVLVGDTMLGTHGTHYRVSRRPDGDEVDVAVYEGSVVLATPGGRETVRAGQRIDYGRARGLAWHEVAPEDVSVAVHRYVSADLQRAHDTQKLTGDPRQVRDRLKGLYSDIFQKDAKPIGWLDLAEYRLESGVGLSPSGLLRAAKRRLSQETDPNVRLRIQLADAASEPNSVVLTPDVSRSDALRGLLATDAFRDLPRYAKALGDLMEKEEAREVVVGDLRNIRKGEHEVTERTGEKAAGYSPYYYAHALSFRLAEKDEAALEPALRALEFDLRDGLLTEEQRGFAWRVVAAQGLRSILGEDAETRPIMLLVRVGAYEELRAEMQDLVAAAPQRGALLCGAALAERLVGHVDEAALLAKKALDAEYGNGLSDLARRVGKILAVGPGGHR